MRRAFFVCSFLCGEGLAASGEYSKCAHVIVRGKGVPGGGRGKLQFAARFVPSGARH